MLEDAMLEDTIIGLAVAVIVISSVAWVSQFRRLRERYRIRKAARAAQQAPKSPDSFDRFAA